MTEMDAVDKQQQREIDDLKVVNERQDSFAKNLVWAFVVYGLIQFFSTITFLNSMNTECPHKECPHAAHND